MKKIIIFTVIMYVMLFFCGCSRVVVTKADELVMSNWSAQTEWGLSGELVFSENEASFTVYDQKGKSMCKLQGAYAIDGENLYITDSTLCKTYTFGYKVYGDKAELEYAEEIITFYPTSEDVTTSAEMEEIQ